jgi:hypothetical protein
MTECKIKKFKNNTFKMVIIWMKGGGFCIEFFKPYENFLD